MIELEQTSHPLTYSINTTDPCDIVAVTAKGCGKPDEVIDMYEKIQHFAQLHHMTKVLLNVVELKLNYSGSDVLKVTKVIETLLPHFRVARVVSPADFRSDLIDLFANTISLEIKSFHDEHHAIEWLTST
ncbi:hypothetical protein PCIT_a2604 [Pseudoalteromonas citrea]|uniref:Uncharacterized protein n=2 Tax=Pseudoalteromonas citrea TaxID=43655 RepID=A0AAD4AHC2_9GAMM|nr:hypothetical protein [Pseudoalteromonas citrea]KAF7769713.1 hypothetical protein PCIT_a2604 [Pseudoalteromonas citrea]